MLYLYIILTLILIAMVTFLILIEDMIAKIGNRISGALYECTSHINSNLVEIRSEVCEITKSKNTI